MPRLTACEPKYTRSACSVLAERGGFEPPEPFSSSAFKAGAFVRSATVPRFPISGYARLSQERCQSGRMGCPAKALTLRGPWVQIPPSPPWKTGACERAGFPRFRPRGHPAQALTSESIRQTRRDLRRKALRFFPRLRDRRAGWAPHRTSYKHVVDMTATLRVDDEPARQSVDECQQ